METDFLNFYDENFANIPSPLYQRDFLDDGDNAILNLIQDDDSYQPSNFGASSDLWETEQELNGDMAILPLTISPDGSIPKIDHGNKEDFHKMLLEWQEHLGTMQTSDTEDMDVKDLMGMNSIISEQIPDNIFEDESRSTEELTVKTSAPKPQLSICMKPDDLHVFNLDNLMESGDEDDEKLPLKIHEQVLKKIGHLKSESGQVNIKSENTSDYENEDCVESNCYEASNLKASVQKNIEVKKEFVPSTCSVVKSENKKIQSLLKHTLQESKQTKTIVKTEPDNHIVIKRDVEHNISSLFPKIKVEPELLDLKLEIDDDCIDIETVSEQIPVLEAGDLKTLLEQFEASEAFSPNVSSNNCVPLQQNCELSKVQPTSLPNMPATASSQVSKHTTGDTTELSAPPAKETGKVANIIVTVSSDVQPAQTTASVSQNVTSVPTFSSPAKCASYSPTSLHSTILSVRKVSNTPPQILKPSTTSISKPAIGILTTRVTSNGGGSPASQCDSPPVQPSHQNIRESFPNELLEKLKQAQGRKKTIPVIPAIPNKRSGRAATRMQDAAAALNRNKLLKIVTGGESIQLDHDYCSVSTGNGDAPRPFYHSDASEYTTATSTPSSKQHQQQVAVECWEKSSRKDSGLESGDVSDASEETVGSSSVASVDSGGIAASSQPAVCTTISQLQPGASLLRKSLGAGVAFTSVSCQKPQSQQTALQQQQGPKKRKLNLEEYRSRLKDRVKETGSVVSNTSSAQVTSTLTPVCNNADDSANNSPAVPELRARPEMCNAEVQADVVADISVSPAAEKKRQLRDRHNRHYRSRRCSSSSSNSSSSSRSPSSSSCSSSHSSSRKHKRSRGRRHHRRKSQRGRRLSVRGHSSSSRSRSSTSRSSRGGSSSRSHSPIRGQNQRSKVLLLTEREKQRQVEERRVIYVGRIDEGTSKAELRRRFEVFGPIVDISVHFREHGDNYGFVTFQYKVDAYEAVEHGNDDPSLPHYDLCFGGRRAFCKTRYADLDGLATSNDGMGFNISRGPNPRNRNQDSFDLLLREAQATIRKRNKV